MFDEGTLGALNLARSWCCDGKAEIGQFLKKILSFSQLRFDTNSSPTSVHYIFIDRPVDVNDAPLHGIFACLLCLGP